MDAVVRKITINPEKRDDETKEIKQPKHALITLQVPMDSIDQKKSIADFTDLMTGELVIVNVRPYQHRIDFPDDDQEAATV